MNKTKLVLGVDVGGTNTVFGLVDKTGNVFLIDSIPTHGDKSAEDLFKRLFEKFYQVSEDAKEDFELAGIGIGAPNANYYKGTVENPPNLNWEYVDIISLIKKFSDAPVALTNDANAAALGEMYYGAAKGMKDLIVITLGTGLGSGIVVNGNLVYGHDGFAGEIGHTIYDPQGRQCGCGRKGCLETYASAPGIKRTVMELIANTNFKSKLRSVSYESLDAKFITELALQGDKIALEAFDFTAKVLGIKLADAIAHTSPEAIILFGGLANAGDLLLVPTKKYLEENVFHVFRNKVKILKSELNEGKSAVLGAAALIWHELNTMVINQ
ncbi:Transcriptional regulator [Ignavibacterium album JCM 16511]|uniref:Transcriptional regulator n=1 Tax=Ignavibacterium album (strain DSM 19864 / JCM 16511 / NBRC 101810 / Mat9-16) TaxID=945713 RepID=I0AMT8_IGNAJ|nr:ROK family protein [Ignavibacterium album]AFH50295.1 Transcriptional regulator [Ignavibacterium album JCM 16511]